MKKVGGSWTEQKLDCVGGYLNCYQTAMKYKGFRTIYIDAFAGSGVGRKMHGSDEILLYPDDQDALDFVDGSPLRALATNPPFSEYHFIELDTGKLQSLRRKAEERFPHLMSRCRFYNSDANNVIKNLYSEIVDWKEIRTVAFLDPYGMHVKWDTLEVMSRGMVDLWWLFPLGQSINRILKRDGNIPEAWKRRLTETFGTPEWENHFYKKSPQQSLFGEYEEKVKSVRFDGLINYTRDRLKSLFPYVHPTPKVLRNSKNNPLFMLCFALSNQSDNAIGLASRLVKAVSER